MTFKHQDNGLLPPGVHWVSNEDSMYEIFGTNEHRRRLLGGFFAGTAHLQRAGCPRVFLDGSFVTTKPFPRDFDCCYDTHNMNFEILPQVFKDFSNDRALQKANFGGEFFPTQSTAVRPWTTFWEFFQTDKETGNPKGIVGFELQI